MDFPVFEVGKEPAFGDEQHRPSGVKFPQHDIALPRIHDGSEERHAEEIYKAVTRAVNPALARAHDMQEIKERQLKAWQAHAGQLRASVSAKKQRIFQRDNAADHLNSQLLRDELKVLEAQLSEAMEELQAAGEELDEATARVTSLQPEVG